MSDLTETSNSNSTQSDPLNWSSDFSRDDTIFSDDTFDLDNDTLSSSNITGRHAFHYHFYRPTYPAPRPLPPSPPTYVDHVPPALYHEPCKCVPFYLCKVKDIVGRATDGEGLIDQRSAAGSATQSPNKNNERSVSSNSDSSQVKPVSNVYLDHTVLLASSFVYQGSNQSSLITRDFDP